MTDTNPPAIGFMQGRLSPVIGGKHQAFPHEHWRDEIPRGNDLGFKMMEWTLDHDGLSSNPLMTLEGRAEIRGLCRRNKFSVPSATLDCVMQAPFFKATGQLHDDLLTEFFANIEACAAARMTVIVLPLVDNGTLQDEASEKSLKEGLSTIDPLLRRNGLRIAFESDFVPERLAEFIAPFPADLYGVNYDIGNSAALGFDPEEEFKAYGDRIIHVHVKDRIKNGPTVPLGQGDANFRSVFNNLSRRNYSGAYILQTARAEDDDHAGPLTRYRNMVADWIDAAAKKRSAA